MKIGFLKLWSIAVASIVLIANARAQEAPVIEVHPLNQSASAGELVLFTVFAAGTPPLTYQWSKNGLPIEGATSSNLVLQNVTEADAGDYHVVVSNEIGSVTSDIATLTIIPVSTGAPVITTQPASQTANPGDLVFFNVLATGDAPLLYQWSKDGFDIEGATSSNLPTQKIPPTMASSNAASRLPRTRSPARAPYSPP